MLSDDLRSIQTTLEAIQAGAPLSQDAVDTAVAALRQATEDARHLEAAALSAEARAVPGDAGGQVVSLVDRRAREGAAS